MKLNHMPIPITDNISLPKDEIQKPKMAFEYESNSDFDEV